LTTIIKLFQKQGKNVCVIIFMFLSSQLLSQNLVPNPSFDSIIIGQSARGIDGNFPYWDTPNEASPDLWHDSLYSDPSNSFPNTNGRYDNQSPRTGPGMVGLIGYIRPINHTTPPRDNNFSHECLQARLNQPLVS
jgi:hypothetical protein